jgi:hypothetical protein
VNLPSGTAQAAEGPDGRLAERLAAIEALREAARRIRQARDSTAIGVALIETAAAYCGRAALLAVEQGALAGWRAVGFPAAFAERLSAFRLSLSDDPAALQAVETRDPVAAAELSSPLRELFAPPSGQRIWLFPLARQARVEALLYADAAGSADGVQPAALELLCLVAEASLEALEARPGFRRPAEPDVVRAARAAAPPPVDFASLPAPERQLHERARRFARLLVADLQLEHPQQVRDGRRSGNLYALLRDDIDRSREAYRRKFANSPAAGVDYFHQELVRTLAANQEQLLGPDYPGPQT